MQIWLPITDEETEDTWKDYYGSTIPNYTLPWVGDGPDGGESESCARVIDENSWSDRVYVIFLSMLACALISQIPT